VEANARVSPELARSGRNRLLETALGMPRLPARASRRFKLVLWAPLTAAVLAAAVLLMFGWRARERPLTYTVVGGHQLATDYLLAPSTTSVNVHFSDGTRVVASPGTRLRVDALASRGARVLVEDGSASANVKHRDGSSWTFVAGPFDVHITGTAFTLAWDARKQEVDLTLREGAVEVESPLGSTHVVVKAGQRFHASLVAGTMQLENADSERSGASASEPTLATTPPTAAAAPTHNQTKSRKQSTRGRAYPDAGSAELAESWTELVRRGAFDEVIDAANAAGVSQSLSSRSAMDVRALADAARYTHRNTLAARSLVRLRERFPGTQQSVAAAFLLGRTQESNGQVREATRAYTAYLSEAPDGEFAAEALAGKMRTVATLESPTAARPIALEYLRHYPNGVHVQTARHLVESD
jgi:TolA-binding protein